MENVGDLGACPQKIVRATPSRMSESAPFKNRIKLVFKKCLHANTKEKQSTLLCEEECIPYAAYTWRGLHECIEDYATILENFRREIVTVVHNTEN